MTLKTCADCGTSMPISATECPECEARQPMLRRPYGKSWLALLLMCLFAGFLGIHRFYVGKVGTGALMLFTFGGLGVWVLYDFIKISMSLFTDKQGNLIVHT